MSTFFVGQTNDLTYICIYCQTNSNEQLINISTYCDCNYFDEVNKPAEAGDNTSQ